MTIKWLMDNYEPAEGVSLPRSSLYTHYLDFCQGSTMTPVNAASFGKIIRQQFPNLKTRRLGTRGQSKYHYYGIGVKATSKYREKLLEASALDEAGEPSHMHLPPFPRPREDMLPAACRVEDVTAFLKAYRAHCQELVDEVASGEYDEMEMILKSFWQAAALKHLSVLRHRAVIDLVAVCDNTLYSTLLSVAIPNVMEPLPTSTMRSLRLFARHFEPWCAGALGSMPQELAKQKMDTLQVFTTALCRQTSLNHLAHAAQTIVRTPKLLEQMLRDWRHLDFACIHHQAATAFRADATLAARCRRIVQQFNMVLSTQGTVAGLTGLLTTVLAECVGLGRASEGDHGGGAGQESGGGGGADGDGGGGGREYQRRAKRFMMKFNYICTLIIRELTIKSAASFSSFHIIRMLLDEFLMYTVERRRASDYAARLRSSIGLEDYNLRSGNAAIPEQHRRHLTDDQQHYGSKDLSHQRHLHAEDHHHHAEVTSLRNMAELAPPMPLLEDADVLRDIVVPSSRLQSISSRLGSTCSSPPLSALPTGAKSFDDIYGMPPVPKQEHLLSPHNIASPFGGYGIYM